MKHIFILIVLVIEVGEKKVVILKNIFELILLNYLLFPNCNYPITQLFTKKFIKIIFEAMNSSNS